MPGYNAHFRLSPSAIWLSWGGEEGEGVVVKNRLLNRQNRLLSWTHAVKGDDVGEGGGFPVIMTSRWSL